MPRLNLRRTASSLLSIAALAGAGACSPQQSQSLIFDQRDYSSVAVPQTDANQPHALADGWKDASDICLECRVYEDKNLLYNPGGRFLYVDAKLYRRGVEQPFRIVIFVNPQTHAVTGIHNSPQDDVPSVPTVSITESDKAWYWKGPQNGP